ncbi:MAG: hypothetical protein U0N40_03165, partial [Oscillospiraceae bacterium]
SRPSGCDTSKLLSDDLKNKLYYDGFQKMLYHYSHHVVASFVSLATTFYALRQKSSRAHSAAPPFQIEPTSLGFDLVFSPQN